MSLGVFDGKAVHRPRNLLAWALFCAASGAVNSSALAACGRLITHITGVATRVGADIGRWGLLFEYALVFLAFLLGAALSSAVLLAGARGGRLVACYRGLFAAEAAVLTVVAVAGHLGVFGPFGQTVETLQDFLLLGLLAFASGLQNATVSSATSNVVRTTHVTGPATDLAVQLTHAVAGPVANREEAYRHARLRALKIGSFVAGGVVAPLFASRLDYLVFLFPILPLAAGALVVFPLEPVDARRSVGA